MKKTTLALAALIALTSGAAMANVKKDYQLNFFAQIEDGFSFERLDGKSWSEAIDIKHSALRDEFESTTVKTMVSLSSTHTQKALEAKLSKPFPVLSKKGDYTQAVALNIHLGGQDLTLGGKKIVKALSTERNALDLVIEPANKKNLASGDYEGTFAIEFEYGV
ncbi:hypothetical protein AB733_19230 [Photobacterium swingsii]|uniref:Fimbrial assembly protein n=1 Tax=Photobacterium swingsii TaxID=680026 RepID=A0A0J8V7N3_9GAMM|nr:CS1 type fimbrial major subunit [Photobacterium swingsii]KMV29236.1 hypothetical protein AB733_19230 [Photobacterium swingsii]PSW23181.1 hypothetical protein C9I94_16275 [Photobacterium swingsii]